MQLLLWTTTQLKWNKNGLSNFSIISKSGFRFILRKKIKAEEEKKKISEQKAQEIIETFEISDEKLDEFIKNEDDLDEWEKDIEDNEVC